MADRRDFLREIAREGGHSLVDLLGLAVRATEDPSFLFGRLAAAEPDDAQPPASREPSAALPAAADLWRWPEVPAPFLPDDGGHLGGPAAQRVSVREVGLQQLLLGGLTVPGGSWVALPAGAGALYPGEEPVQIAALAGEERPALEPAGRDLAAVERVGVALGRGHEAWVEAIWREAGLPHPQVVVERPEGLAALRRQGVVDALVVNGGGTRSLPRWALLAPRTWVLPAGWEAALAGPWRLPQPGAEAAGLSWLLGMVQAAALPG